MNPFGVGISICMENVIVSVTHVFTLEILSKYARYFSKSLNSSLNYILHGLKFSIQIGSKNIITILK